MVEIVGGGEWDGGALIEAGVEVEVRRCSRSQCCWVRLERTLAWKGEEEGYQASQDVQKIGVRRRDWLPSNVER